MWIYKIENITGQKVDDTLIAILKRMEPFGQGNERPKLLSRACLVADKQTMGSDGQHIKFRIKGKNGNFISAVGFSQSERWQDIRIGDTIDIVYFADVNEFNGRSEIQLKIVDIKIA